MSQYVPESGISPEIERRDQLIEYFAHSVKPREQWRIGTEYEKVAVRRSDGRAVPFSGPRGIETLLKRLADRYDWEPLEEDGRIVALRGGKAAITLEPGGQVELSGEVCESVHCAAAELAEHIDQIVTVGDQLDIAFLGLGMQPVTRTDEFDLVPKKRYRIMWPYMARVGSLGQRMMSQTATVQVNVDYGSEADAMQKLRVGMGIGSLLTAMFANSPLSDGDLNGYRSFRGHIWTDTDKARSGLLRFVFDAAAGFEHYVEWALDVPMYFIVRDGAWIDMTAHTFRDFLAHGVAGHRATMADWSVHLTTLFPEARMKGYIELRAADSQAPELMLALPALAKGILYEPDCLQAAWDLVKSWSWDERLELWHAVHAQALQARIRRIGLAEIARELVAIAVEGLRRQRQLDAAGRDESIYLERLARMVARGRCPADAIVEQWIGAWNGDVQRLIEGSSYRIAA
ncbi:glutamate--cysteine ligase [bacterium]|nr:glutamate--cysteine ligase [bacterium]